MNNYALFMRYFNSASYGKDRQVVGPAKNILPKQLIPNWPLGSRPNVGQ